VDVGRRAWQFQQPMFTLRATSRKTANAIAPEVNAWRYRLQRLAVPPTRPAQGFPEEKV